MNQLSGDQEKAQLISSRILLGKNDLKMDFTADDTKNSTHILDTKLESALGPLVFFKNVCGP